MQKKTYSLLLFVKFSGISDVRILVLTMMRQSNSYFLLVIKIIQDFMCDKSVA